MISVSRDKKVSVAITREQHGRSQKISIASELASLNSNSLVKANQSSAIRSPNIVIEPLCSEFHIFLNYHASAYFQSRNSVLKISVAARDRK